MIKLGARVRIKSTGETGVINARKIEGLDDVIWYQVTNPVSGQSNFFDPNNVELLETSMDLQVGDRVKVKDSEYTKPRNLAGRYGHIVELSEKPNGTLEARIAFNDFQQWIPTSALQKCPS